MTQLTQQQTARLTRYHGQSVRRLRDAMNEARQARWLRTEELLWGSVTLAVKSVALVRGDEVDDRKSVEEYAQALGQEHNDRRIRDAFSRLSTFADVADRMRDSRGGAQQLVSIAHFPWLLLPAVFVIVTVLSFNFLGDGLRDAADPYTT